MKLYNEILADRPDLKKVTVNNYVDSIASLIYKLIGEDPIDNYDASYAELFTDVPSILSFIYNIKNSKTDKPLALSSHNKYILGVMILLGIQEDKYESTLKEYRKEYEKNVIAGKKKPKTTNERKQWTSMSALKAKLSTKKKELTNSKKSTVMLYMQYRNYVIYALHVLAVPRRNIYRTVKVLHPNIFARLDDEKLKSNWLVIDDDTAFFYFGDQKSATLNGESIPVKKNLFEILKNYIDTYNITNYDYLLTSMVDKGGGEQMTRQSYTNVLKRGLGVSSAMIRKIYATENMKPEIVGMGNSQKTRYNYYYKP